MATKPVSRQEQGLVNSLDEWVNESWAQGKVGVTMTHKSPLQNKKAPRAEPEEDIDVLEPGAQDETLQENQTFLRTKTVDMDKLGTRELTRINLCTHMETQDMVTELRQVAQLSEVIQTQGDPEESVDLCEEAFPPFPPLSASSTAEYLEKEGFSSLEREVAEWISDAKIISDPTGALTSPDSHSSQEWPETPPLTEPFDREVDSTSEEMTGDNVRTEKNITKLAFLPDAFDNREAEYNVPAAAAAEIKSTHHFPTDKKSSDDFYSACSPPFADESEEEEEAHLDIMSCQQQWTVHDFRSKPFQPSYNANASVSSGQTSSLPVVPSAVQQKEPLTQRQCDLAPRGANQEAAQQVLGQGTQPLSSVAMVLSNQGGAASQGSGCVVRERHSGAGERTEGERKQTGGERGQKEGGRERNKVVGQQHGGGLLKPLTIVQTEELETEKYRFVSSKHGRMESDSCDDSQSDSGVSADFSPCSTLEGNTTISTGTPAAVLKETPIEREIRRAVEREQSLRRSRGLPNPPTSPEYVDIPLRKTVLCQSAAAKSDVYQGKDRQFAGKKMQHEIHEEVQREQDLVKLGKVPGFYDKGTVRQLKERKQLFEDFQKPSDSTLTMSAGSKALSWSSASDISTLENQDDSSSQASTIGGSYEENSHKQSTNSVKGRGLTSLATRGPGFSEGTGRHVIILENNLSVPAQKLHRPKPEAEPVTVVDYGRPKNSSSRTGGQGGIKGRAQEQVEEVEEEVTPKENPFFKLRSSTNLIRVEKDIREAQEREKELHRQRINLYGGVEVAKGGVGGGGCRPVSSGGKSPMLSSSSMNGHAVPDLPASSSRVVSGRPAARQSVGKLGMWPPAQADEEKINRPEVVHSPRTPRQKNPLVQRWESGLINGHNEEDD